LFRSTKPVPVSPLTVPPIVKLLVVQVTLMFATSVLATVSGLFVMVQVWLGVVGCVRTLTAYVAPLASFVVKVNPVAVALTLSFPPPFS
jgi:hypothetical protein